MNNERKAIFDSAWNRCAYTLEFDRRWSNGTGMYDYAVYGEFAPKIPYGTMHRSQTPGGRKLLIIGTRLGNMVVFEFNISDRKGAPPIYRYQSTSQMAESGFFSQNVLDEYELEVAVGTENQPHIGTRVDALYAALKRA